MDDAKAIAQGCRLAAPYRFQDPVDAGAGQVGLQRGNPAGASLDFKDFREYQPGDDIRHIDWQAYARTDKPVLRLYHEEVTPHLDLMLDQSKSMDLPGSSKRQAVLELTAFFASVAAQSSFSKRLWLCGANCQPHPGGDGPPSGWTRISFDEVTPPGQGLLSAHGLFRNQALRVFISDLFWPGDPLPILAALARGAASLLVVQVLAEQDLNPVAGGKHLLVDAETGRSHHIQLNQSAVNQYKNRLDQHLQEWRQASRQTGATLVTVNAESLKSDWIPDAPGFERFLKIRKG